MKQSVLISLLTSLTAQQALGFSLPPPWAREPKPGYPPNNPQNPPNRPGTPGNPGNGRGDIDISINVPFLHDGKRDGRDRFGEAPFLPPGDDPGAPHPLPTIEPDSLNDDRCGRHHRGRGGFPNDDNDDDCDDNQPGWDDDCDNMPPNDGDDYGIERADFGYSYNDLLRYLRRECEQELNCRNGGQCAKQCERDAENRMDRIRQSCKNDCQGNKDCQRECERDEERRRDHIRRDCRQDCDGHLECQRECQRHEEWRQEVGRHSCQMGCRGDLECQRKCENEREKRQDNTRQECRKECNGGRECQRACQREEEARLDRNLGFGRDGLWKGNFGVGNIFGELIDNLDMVGCYMNCVEENGEKRCERVCEQENTRNRRYGGRNNEGRRFNLGKLVDQIVRELNNEECEEVCDNQNECQRRCQRSLNPDRRRNGNNNMMGRNDRRENFRQLVDELMEGLDERDCHVEYPNNQQRRQQCERESEESRRRRRNRGRYQEKDMEIDDLAGELVADMIGRIIGTNDQDRQRRHRHHRNGNWGDDDADFLCKWLGIGCEGQGRHGGRGRFDDEIQSPLVPFPPYERGDDEHQGL